MYTVDEKRSEMCSIHILCLFVFTVGMPGLLSAMRGTWTSLHAAVSRGDIGDLEYALGSLKMMPYGIDHKWFGMTALGMAVEEGEVELTDRLLCAGAKVLDDTQDGFISAIEKGRVSMVRLLIEKLNLGKDSLEGLYHAAEKGHVGIAKALLNAVVEASEANYVFAVQALHIAVCIGHVPFVRCLLDFRPAKAPKFDAKRLIKSRDSKERTVLMLLADFRCERFEMVRLLLRYGATKRAQDCDGWTALHFASRRGHARIVEVLLGVGSKCTVRTAVGQTPLQLAAAAGHVAVMNLLLKDSTKGEINAHMIGLG